MPLSHSMKEHLLIEGTDKFQGHRYKKDALLRSLIFEHEMKRMKRPPDPLVESYYESSKVYRKLRVSIQCATG